LQTRKTVVLGLSKMQTLVMDKKKRKGKEQNNGVEAASKAVSRINGSINWQFGDPFS
jgi:hypothetical protein